MMTRHKKSDQRRGVVTVEAALVFPILLALTFGLIEYAWLFLRMETITNAARRGARLAITPDATEAEVRSAVNNMLTNAGIAFSGTDIDVGSLDVNPGEVITVHIEVDYESLTGIGGPLLPVPQRIGRSMSMAKEGP